MKKSTVGDVVFGGVLVWAAIATFFLVRASRGQPGVARSPARSVPVHVSGWRALAAHGHATGPVNAAMTMVVFSDFQCPYCRRFARVVDSLRQQHPDVRIVERNFPIVALHPNAFSAALAAECADHLHRYPRMRHVLFSKVGLVIEGEWGLLARDASIADTSAFRQCIVAGADSSVVQADLAAAKSIGVYATPSIVINDSLYTGGISLDALERRVARLAGAR